MSLTEEPSYNFGGQYTKGTTRLTIDVRDGSYWALFSARNGTDSLTCELSEKASVKNGMLLIQSRQGKQPFTMIISPADHTKKMVVRGFRRADRDVLMHICQTSIDLAGSYTRVPLS